MAQRLLRSDENVRSPERSQPWRSQPLPAPACSPPTPIELDRAATALLIIDMRRDFLEPGGFGETLGNDVSQLARAVKPCAVKSAAIASLPQQRVLYHGPEVMGGGSIRTGLVLGAIGVFVIERDFVKASAFALSGAVLTYLGFMHGEAVGAGGGLGVTPHVALAYALVSAVFLALAKLGTSSLPICIRRRPLLHPPNRFVPDRDSA